MELCCESRLLKHRQVKLSFAADLISIQAAKLTAAFGTAWDLRCSALTLSKRTDTLSESDRTKLLGSLHFGTGRSSLRELTLAAGPATSRQMQPKANSNLISLSVRPHDASLSRSTLLTATSSASGAAKVPYQRFTARACRAAAPRGKDGVGFLLAPATHPAAASKLPLRVSLF